MNRIERKFQELKRAKKKAFIAFITAGYPDLQTTAALVREFARAGVDIVELGIPFTDPIADGPLIQQASQEALKQKTNLGKVLKLVKALRRDTDIPLCLMTYYNPLFCFGEKAFVRRAVTSGVDGLIIPDLPPEESPNLNRLARKAGLDIIYFLSPTSTPARIRLVSRQSRGFIYFVSLTGVTGIRRNLPAELAGNLRLIKAMTTKPVCVGFGVSQPAQVRELARLADGVIVGSAIIRRIKQNLQRRDLAKRVANFVRRLKG
jgi:tryptophan synthase alpha chain